MRILLKLAFILGSFSGFSQTQLTLVIDTIDFIDGFDPPDFRIVVTNQGFANLGQIDSTAKISRIDFPNFQTTVALETDSSNIHIPIDQHNGYLELSNVYNSDTIRINALRLYSNCYRDTMRSRIEYSRVKDNIVSDQCYKVEFKERVKKKKIKRKTPLKTTLIINDQEYVTSIQKTKWLPLISSGNGYKPRMTEKNYENYSGTKFHILSVTEQYINVMTVKIR